MVAHDFTDETIVRLFGHSEAEREEPARLVEYFFKNDAYTRVRANLRLRILVGYKGAGKSALFKICELEDQRDGIASVWIRPDDIAHFSANQSDLNARIREWKQGIQDIIFRKVADEFGQTFGEADGKLLAYGRGFLQSLITFATARLGNVTDPSKRVLVNGFLKKKRLVVYLDDLDSGWAGSAEHTAKIAAMLNAVRNIVADTQGIYFRVALRSDVYHVVRISDSNGDKIEGDVIWMQWTNDDIFRVLVRRVATFDGKAMELAAFGAMSQERLAQYLNGVFEHKFHGRGLWDHRDMYQVILSFVRAKPRDIVLFCTGAARVAARKGHNIITSTDVEEGLPVYCQGRVDDLVMEFKSELPNLDRLIKGMKVSQREIKERKGNRYTTDELVEKLKNIISSHGKFVFCNGSVASPMELLRFLFKITFITARKEMPSGFVDRKYFDEATHLTTEYADYGYSWEIHPAYRWALSQDAHSNLLSQVELTDISFGAK